MTRSTAVITYLIVYAAMNLGAFAVVLAVARKTHSGEIDSYGGLFNYAPGLTVAMTIFLFSLAGMPPLGGWIAKFAVFNAVLSPAGGWAVTLAVIGAVNSVIALYYYANVGQADVDGTACPTATRHRSSCPSRSPPRSVITVGGHDASSASCRTSCCTTATSATWHGR